MTIEPIFSFHHHSPIVAPKNTKISSPLSLPFLSPKRHPNLQILSLFLLLEEIDHRF